jgi:Bacterial protein of unknown function (DUF885)
MWKSLLAGTALTGALVLLNGCGQSPTPTQPAVKTVAPGNEAWKKTAAGFMEDYLHADPFFAAQQGRHEFDGQLRDMSAHGIKRQIAMLHEGQKTISAVDPKTLAPREQFDRENLLSVISQDLFWLEKTKFPNNNPSWYLQDLDPDMYLSRDYAPLDVRMKAYIKYARGVPRMAKDIQENLKSPLPKSYVEVGIAQFGGLADFFAKMVTPVFASVSDPDLQKQLAEADTNAANAMGNLKQYLVGERKNANDSFALGADLFAQMLKDTQLVDMPVDQIEAAGKADLDRNIAALKVECATYAPKASLAQCVGKVDADKPKQGPVEEARTMLPTLKDFVQKNNVVSIPNDGQALVAEAPPYNAQNAAYINIPGPFDHNVASIYNIAPPDPKWNKSEQAAYIKGESILLMVTVHEVWPGHFLQFLHSNSNPNKLESLWVSSAFAEGWAHYSEEMMIEMGLGKGEPEKHIGQLVEALLRDVRLLSAIGMHTKGMTVAQSEKMFREQAFQDPGNARQQAARGTYDPSYLVYTMGKLMIRKLRTDWLAKTAPGSAPDDQSHWHEFHDAFLSYGGPPIPLLRKQLVGEGGTLL